MGDAINTIRTNKVASQERYSGTDSNSLNYGTSLLEKMPKSHSVVKVGRTSVGAACTPAGAIRSFFEATAFLVTARRFFFAAFLPVDLSFRVRIAFFVAARFLGVDIFLSTSNMCTARISQHMKRW
jgi:hypothetical protein